MPETLGFSVYLNTFDEQWPLIRNWAHKNAPIFLSLNMGKGAADLAEAERICHLLADNGFRTIADVSTETCELFGEKDLLLVAKKLRLWALRIDYGFTPEEIGAMAKVMPIVLNASTTDPQAASRVFKDGQPVFALHNFYPRTDTGLNREMLMETTRNLQAAGLKVQAFIHGDSKKRDPIFEGLPTLEEHRYVLPSAAFADLSIRFHMDDIFVGDPGISDKEQQRIDLFCRENILSIPCTLLPEFSYLYDLTFTCRVDSPDRLIRLEESRTTYKRKEPLAPTGAVVRERGMITMDNSDYALYLGEVQIMRKTLKPDARVNAIGSVPQEAQLLLDCIRGGQKFRLVKP